jgi:hypothetical protein
MPLGACNRCGHVYVLAARSAARRTCPVCKQPLRLITHEEAVAHLREAETREPSPPAPEEMDR